MSIDKSFQDGQESARESFTYQPDCEMRMTDWSVEFSNHALEKMKARAVNMQDIKETIQDPALLFEDVESSALVAIRQIGGKYLVVIYSPGESTAKVITVYHSTNIDKLIRNKLQREAWLEK